VKNGKRRFAKPNLISCLAFYGLTVWKQKLFSKIILLFCLILATSVLQNRFCLLAQQQDSADVVTAEELANSPDPFLRKNAQYHGRPAVEVLLGDFEAGLEWTHKRNTNPLLPYVIGAFLLLFVLLIIFAKKR